MPAPLSVIIPVLNSAPRLGPVLAALAVGLAEGLIAEVIFADGGSTDETEQIAEATGARFIACQRGRGVQLATGAEQAKGAWLLFLHDDTILPGNWPELVSEALREPAHSFCFCLRFDDPSWQARWLAGWANRRTNWFGLPFGDQGLLIPRETYDKAGGFRSIPLMEDVDLVRRLHPRPRLLKGDIVTSAERYRRNGWWRQSWQNGWRQLRFLLGVSPKKLAKDYDAWPPSNCSW